MKRIIILSFVASVFLFSSFVQKAETEEIKWLSWNEGFAKSQKENKIALIDVYTDWCYWCKVMDKETYTKKEIQDLIAQHFIPIKFNPELAGKYYTGNDTLNGQELLGALSGGNSSGFPTTYFYVTNSKIMYQQAGYQEAAAFKAILLDMIEKQKNPEKK